MSWYTKGAEANASQANKSASNSGGKGFDKRNIFRFYMKQGDSRMVMFLDDTPLNTWAHNFEKDGRWGNWMTCPKKTGVSRSCPLCDKKNYPRHVGHYTLVDITGWETKDGDTRMSLKILPAPADLVAKLERRRKSKGTLIGAIFEVTRDGKVSVGDDWNWVESKNVSQFLEENFDALYKSLSYYPEEWGFWEWKDGKAPGPNDKITDEKIKNDRQYYLKGLPFMDILEPLSAEALADYIRGELPKEDDSFDFGANQGASNDVEY